MKNYSKNDVILVRYPFSDLLNYKVRPAVIINTPHTSEDIFIVPLTSKTKSLASGEFILKDWEKVGLIDISKGTVVYFGDENYQLTSRVEVQSIYSLLNQKII